MGKTISIVIISYTIRKMCTGDFMNGYIYKREDFSNPILKKKKNFNGIYFSSFIRMV